MLDLTLLRLFFMWCTILNVTLLLAMFLAIALAGDFVYRMHGIWFRMPRQTFDTALYGFFGLFKLLVIVFNLVPYVALLIMD
jgi:hypothetical protein